MLLVTSPVPAAASVTFCTISCVAAPLLLHGERDRRRNAANFLDAPPDAGDGAHRAARRILDASDLRGDVLRRAGRLTGQLFDL